MRASTHIARSGPRLSTGAEKWVLTWGWHYHRFRRHTAVGAHERAYDSMRAHTQVQPKCTCANGPPAHTALTKTCALGAWGKLKRHRGTRRPPEHNNACSLSKSSARGNIWSLNEQKSNEEGDRQN